MNYILLLLFVLPFNLIAQHSKKDSLVNKAVDFVYQDNYDSAIVYFTQVIALSPNDEIAYLDRGLAYEKTHQINEAIVDFSSQIKIDTTLPDGYFLRGILEQKLGDTAAAAADFSKVIEIDFYNSDAHYYLGQCQLYNGNHKNANTSFENAMQANPENYQVLPDLIQEKLFLKDTQNMSKWCEALLFFENKAQVEWTLGLVDIFNSKNSEGLIHLKKAILLGYLEQNNWFRQRDYNFISSKFRKLLNQEWKKAGSQEAYFQLLGIELGLNLLQPIEKQLKQINTQISEPYLIRIEALYNQLQKNYTQAVDKWEILINTDSILSDYYWIGFCQLRTNMDLKACLNFHLYLTKTTAPFYYDLYRNCMPKN